MSLLIAIRFFETAGDVAPEKCIGRHAALESAAKEFELRRKKEGEAAGEATGRRQAQPLLLSILAALER